MDDSNACKDDRHEIDIKIGKQPKVEEQRNVDAKTTDEPPKVVAPKVDVAHKVDFRIEFTTERKFDDREQMLSWVHDLSFKEYVQKEREEMTTLKCGCPFKVKSYLLSSRQWSLNVVKGEHNYEMTQHFQGHEYAEWLRLNEKDLVRELTGNMALPRNIMSTLKKRRQLTATTIKHINLQCTLPIESV
ncbi:otubain [Trifolium medium]|uniref:Otubain n=1 Tax=Trifolium medium TaxID=97028 RepID=A0A392MQD0_9FABA|nr:otubain [Trifolium medium]